MIYNLRRYLELKFPLETIFINLADKIYPNTKIPDRCVVLREGPSRRQNFLVYFTIQIYTRDIDGAKARALAHLFYDELKERYGLPLPADTVDGTVFPALQTAQISAEGAPQAVGFDEAARAEFSTNFLVIWRD
jgi:hypothetical protein